MRYFLIFLLAAVALAQDNPVLRSSVHEVLLDVVVRHKNLTLATGLSTSDFRVTEDGVQQNITSLRWVGAKAATVEGNAPARQGINAVPADPKAESNSTRTVSFVSVVFGNIDPSNRKTALNAAAEFLRQQFQVNTYAAIFSLRTRLDVVTTFTTDKQRLEEDAKFAATASPATLIDRTANVLNQTVYQTSGGRGGITTTSLVNPASTPDLALADASANPMSEAMQGLTSMLLSEPHILQYNAGMETYRGLLSLVKYESGLPGRKTILYISDGLIKAPGREDSMMTLIGAANRGNVTFYAVDSRGLTMANSNGASATMTATAAADSARQFSGSHGDSSKLDEFDVMEDALASNPQLAMDELARETGGFAVFNTSDFKKAMLRMTEDMQSHYELTYVPTSTVYDGRFRVIKVSVNQPKMIVQTRSGYFAVPDLDGKPVSVTELAGLHALDEKPRPADFPFRVAAIRFHPEADAFEYEITFEIPLSGLTVPLTSTKKTARVHADCLALLKSMDGQIVAKVSNEIDREIPAKNLDQFKRGVVTLSATAELKPGHYVLEAAAVDPEGKRASTTRVSVVVANPGTPAISNLLLARTIAPRSGMRDPADPFELEGETLTPNLIQSVAPGKDAVLYFVVYPRRDASGVRAPEAKVIVDLLQDGKRMQRLEPPINAPDELGSVPVMLTAQVPPGDYVARVTVVQGPMATQESLAFRVEGGSILGHN